MANRRVLLIGIDGGSWSVLKPAIRDGYMPCLKRIVSEGSSGVLKSTLPANTPCAWSSFQTGINPGKHGITDFQLWDKERRSNILVNSTLLSDTLWSTVSNQGGQVGLVNVPMTYPPHPLNGFVLAGLLTPSTDHQFTHPPGLKENILSEFPEYHIYGLGAIPKQPPSGKAFKQFVEGLARNVETRAKVARACLHNRENLDILMVHFQASDVLQHMCWPYIERGSGLYDPEIEKLVFERFYQQLDSAISYLIREFREAIGEFDTLIASDHGFEAHKRVFNLGNWLSDKGYLDQGETNNIQHSFLDRAIQRLDLFNLRKILPSSIRYRVQRMLDNASRSLEDFSSYKSSVIASGFCNEASVYLLTTNTDHRDELIQTLKNQLSGVEDPTNGKKPVQGVYTPRELYGHRSGAFLPDLIVEPSSGYSITGHSCPDQDTFRSIQPGRDTHLGKHHRDGIVVTQGFDSSLDVTAEAAIIDIAPTVLALLGINASYHIDGSSFASKRTIQDESSEKTLSSHPEGQVYSDKDSEAIKQRLKDLGYM